MDMEITETVYFSDRKEWRKWLSENFRDKKEIWLINPHKASSKNRIPYNDAVEEALCFGWIDSTIKKYDPESSAQRYTPRRKRSSYSQPNKERLRWLLDQNMVHPSLADAVRDVVNEEFVFPDDIIDEIRKDPGVWENYNNFSEPYKRIRVAYINVGRARPEEFRKRLDNFIKKTRENKMVGYGGIDKYF